MKTKEHAFDPANNSVEDLEPLIGRTNNIDCFEGYSYLEDSTIDFVFTSPPYNRKRNDKYSNYTDMTDWLELLNKTVENSFRVLKDDGYLILNIQKNFYNKKDYYKFMGDHYKEIVESIVWTKSNPMPASSHNITNSYEVFLVLNVKGKSIKAQHTYTKNSFETAVNSNNKFSDIHKAVMSLEAGTKIFTDFIGTNKTVVDPFAGVGTTQLLCKEFKDTYLGFELDPEYTKIANLRTEES